MIGILINYHSAFLGGLLVTMELVLGIALVGIPLGIVIGVVGARYTPLLATAIHILHFLTSAIPVLVLLFWLHYPLQSLLHIVVNPFITTVFALGLVNCILTAELVRHELELLPSAYSEAGKTLGLSNMQTAQLVELPILSRRVVPQLLANQAQMLQYTLLSSFIAVPELFRVAQNVNSMVYRPVEVYTLLVLFFLLILGPVHLLVNHLKQNYVYI